MVGTNVVCYMITFVIRLINFNGNTIHILDLVSKCVNYRLLYADRIFLVISLLNLLVDLNFVISSDIVVLFFPKLA